VSSDTPSWCAFTAVAPIVRFRAFEIFLTPVFFLASDFSSRTSDEVHTRRDTVFFLAGILVPCLWNGLLSHQISFATLHRLAFRCDHTANKMLKLESIKANLEVEQAGEMIAIPEWESVKFGVRSLELPAYRWRSTNC
jgi:hypothetical protein